MSDEVDRVNERETLILALQVASSLSRSLSTEEVDAIVQKGRDCVDCGLPIPALRLRAMPRAVRCVKCQQDYEGGKK
ncbi:TraR/DksA family transcriptional regulator [Frederiksenia canicola]